MTACFFVYFINKVLTYLLTARNIITGSQQLNKHRQILKRHGINVWSWEMDLHSVCIAMKWIYLLSGWCKWLLPVMGKSQIKSQSEITNHLIKRFKSLCQITNQISWNEIKSKSLEPKSQIKWNHDVNQTTTVPDSIVYVWNVINVHLAWLSVSL